MGIVVTTDVKEKNRYSPVFRTHKSANRLTHIYDADTNLVASYTYDPFGRRIKKQVGTNVTYYLYSDEGLIAEYDSNGNEVQSYGYAPNSLWMNNPLYTRTESHTSTNKAYYYYLNDHLGAPQKLMAKNGEIVWSGVSEAFGKTTVTIETIKNNLRFSSQYYDEESGLHYNTFRYYDTQIGWYLSRDLLSDYGSAEGRIYRSDVAGAMLEEALRTLGVYSSDSKDVYLHYSSLSYLRGLLDKLHSIINGSPSILWLSDDLANIDSAVNPYMFCENNPEISFDQNGLLTVHIWDYRGKDVAWGHASITLDDGTHISWWPQAQGRNRKKHFPMLYSVDANNPQTMQDDISMEGQCQDKDIKIDGLDEQAIKDWWKEYQQNNKWKTLSQNCSTTVALALRAGGARVRLLDWGKAHNIVWTPSDVDAFSEAINRYLHK